MLAQDLHFKLQIELSDQVCIENVEPHRVERVDSILLSAQELHEAQIAQTGWPLPKDLEV